MAKKIIAKIKLQIPAAKANPAPPVGPALAQHGLNIAEFCKKFNDLTKDKAGWKLPVEITVYGDKTYSMEIKQPLTSELIKKTLGIDKGSGEPNRRKIAKITKEQLRKIAEKKLPDLNTKDVKKAMKIIAGTAKNMGVEVEE